MPFDLSQFPVASTLEKKVAGPKIDSLGRRWDPALHPRDSRGRFIETGGIARVWGGGVGKIMRTLLGGKVEVKTSDGKTKIVPSGRVTMLRRPDGSAPTRNARKVADEDARREQDPKRGDGKLTADDHDGDGIPDYLESVNFPDDEEEARAEAERLAAEGEDEDDEDVEVPDAYSPSRENAKEGDFLAIVAPDKNGDPKYLIGTVTETDGEGKATKMRLPGSKGMVVDLNGDKVPGRREDDTVIPREDVKDPAALFAELSEDGVKPSVLDADLAADLVEGHAHSRKAKVARPFTDADAPEDISMVPRSKDGEVEFQGQTVGRIAKGENGKWTVTDADGNKVGESASWDRGREKLARHLAKQPKTPTEKPAKAPKATPQKFEVGDRVNTPQGPGTVRVVVGGAKPMATVDLDAGGGARVRLERLTPADAPDSSAAPDVDTPGAPAPKAPAAAKKPGGGATKIVHDANGRKGYQSRSGHLAVFKDDGAWQVYQEVPEASKYTIETDGRHYEMTGRGVKNLGVFRDEWIGTERDTMGVPREERIKQAEQERVQHNADFMEYGDYAVEVGSAQTPEEVDALEQRIDSLPESRREQARHLINATRERMANQQGDDQAAPTGRGAADVAAADRAALDARRAEDEAHDADLRNRAAAAETQDELDAVEADAQAIQNAPRRAAALDAIATRREQINQRDTAGDEDRVTIPAAEREADLADLDATERPSDTPEPTYPESNAPEGATDEDSAGVRDDRGESLDDVPAVGDSSDPAAGEDRVLPEPGAAGRGDRDVPGGRAPGEDEPTGRQPGAGRTPRAGVRSESGERGAEGTRAPAAGGRAGVRAGAAGRGDDADRAGGPESAEPRGVGQDFKPRSQADLGNAGNQEKQVAANMEALRTLRKVQAENRPATPEEQAVLAKYAGWGALPQVFVTGNDKYAAEREELKSLMSDEDYQEALNNTRNAHYTDAALVQPMWDALKALGFDGGDVLEAGSGSGNFIGFAPDGARMHGIEKNGVTAEIAQLLYPSADIRKESFADTVVRPGQYDAMIGNVPFADTRLMDKEHNPGRKMMMHDHFIAKGVAGTKPGGVIAVVTSSGTMDKGDSTHRRKIAETADLVTAIRLPSNAHQAAAGTKVVTDLLVFRVRKPGEEPGDLSWVQSDEVTLPDGGTVQMNPYFQAHPENVLGEVYTDTGRFQTGSRIGVKGDPATTIDRLTERLDAAVADAKAAGRGYDPEDVAAEKAPVKTLTSKRTQKKAKGEAVTFEPPSARTQARPKKLGQITHTGTVQVAGKRKGAAGSLQHSFTIVDFDGTEKEYVPDGASSAGMTPKNGKTNQADELVALLRLRDLQADLQDAEKESAEDTPEIEDLRESLNEAYDAYVKVYGPINRVSIGRKKVAAPKDPEDESQTEGLTEEDGQWYKRTQTKPGMGGIRKDPTFWNVAGLEKKYDEETGTAEQADLFTMRQVGHRELPTSASTPADALAISREVDGRVDLERIANLLGMDSAERARESLGTLVFEDHETGEIVPRHLYLAGHTRRKLAQLEELAKKDAKWIPNRDAMAAAVPPAKPATAITAKLGMPWIPEQDLSQFVRDLTGNSSATVRWDDQDGMWKVSANGRAGNTQLEGGRRMRRPDGFTGVLKAKWGTGRRSSYDLIENTLRGNRAEVKDKHPDFGDVLNVEETEAAREIQDAINDEFEKWWKRDPERRDRLAGEYNDRYRSYTEVNYVDSPARQYEGMNDEVILDPHQNDAVTMAMDAPAVLLDHEVGTGKTFTYGAVVMELKRLGKVNKPVVVVPNHLLEQAVREFKHLYPQANVLAGDSKSLSSLDDKRRFIGQSANSDWDAVFLTKNAFAAIPLDEARMVELDSEKVNDLKEKRDDALEKGDTKNVKKFEAQIEALEEKIKELRDRMGSDAGALDFRTAGFDYVVVDEAHEYKNDEIESSSRQMENKQANLHAIDLREKLDYLREINAEAGKKHVALFASGTPVSNSTREFYVMARFLRPDLLEEGGIRTFDDFYKLYLTADEQIAPSVTGKLQTKLRDGDALVNAGEMKRIWSQFADTVTADDVGIERPTLKGGRGTKVAGTVSENQHKFLAYLQVRRDKIKPKFKPEPGDDTVVAIGTDGLTAAVDLRLIPDAKLWEAGIDPADLTDDDSKVGLIGDAVLEEWNRTKDFEFETFKGSGEISPNKGGFQIVFCDKGTPKADGSHSYYQALKDHLVKNGMKASDVAFIHDAADAAAVGKLMEKARQGQIKVLIGSTGKMGTGMNVQNRATKLHHVDGAYRPDQIEQRNGRVLRRGNQNDEVEIAYYPLAGSTEGFQWSHVARKDNFLREFAKADLDATVVGSPEADFASEADTMKAISADQPLLTEEIQVNLALKRIRRERDSIISAKEYHEGNIVTGKNDLRRFESWKSALNAAETFTKPTKGDAFKIATTDLYGRDTGEVTKRKDAAAWLQKRLDGMDFTYVPMGYGHQQKLGTLGGQQVYMRTLRQGGAPVQLEFMLADPKDTSYRPQMLPVESVKINPKSGADTGTIARLENLVASIPDNIERIEDLEETKRKEIEVSEVEKNVEFEHGPELEALEARHAALRALMSNENAERAPELQRAYDAATERYKTLRDARQAAGPSSNVEMGAVRKSRREAKQEQAAKTREALGETLPIQSPRKQDATDPNRKPKPKGTSKPAGDKKPGTRKSGTSGSQDAAEGDDDGERITVAADDLPNIVDEDSDEPFGTPAEAEAEQVMDESAAADEPIDVVSGDGGADEPPTDAPAAADEPEDDDRVTVAPEDLDTLDEADETPEAPAEAAPDAVDQDLADIESDDRRDFAPDPWHEDEGADDDTMTVSPDDLETIGNADEWDEADEEGSIPSPGQEFEVGGTVYTMGESTFDGFEATDADGNTVELTLEDLDGWEPYEAPEEPTDDAIDGLDVPEAEAPAAPARPKAPRSPAEPTTRPGAATPSAQDGLDFSDVESTPDAPTIGDAIAEQEAEDSDAAAVQAAHDANDVLGDAATEAIVGEGGLSGATPEDMDRLIAEADRVRGEDAASDASPQDTTAKTSPDRWTREHMVEAPVKVRAGLYTVDTALGEFTIEQRDGAGDGYGSKPKWWVTGPDSDAADDVYDTRKEALSAIRGQVADEWGTRYVSPDEQAQIDAAKAEADAAEQAAIDSGAFDEPLAADADAPETPALEAPQADTTPDDAPEAPEAPEAEADEAPADEPTEAAPAKLTGGVAGGIRFDSTDDDQTTYLSGSEAFEARKTIANVKVGGRRMWTLGESPTGRGRAWQVTGTGDERRAALEALAEAMGGSVKHDGADDLDGDGDKDSGKTEFPPTPQQQKVLDAFKKGMNVVVRALAGTGKTSTMVKLAKENPDKSILYLAFNRSIAGEAKRKMPKNVKVQTADALAFHALPSDALRKRIMTGAKKPDEVARILGINEPVRRSEGPDLSPTEVAVAAVRTVSKWAISADKDMSAKHVPEGIRGDKAAEQAVLKYARKAWKDDYTQDDGRLRFLHEHSMKMYALSNPTLNYDAVFFDEAQDANDVLAGMLRDQDTQVVVVGDSNQSIYGFRGASDQLDTWKAEADLPLTVTWRMGPVLTDVGNRFLQLTGTKMRLEGNPNKTGEIVHDMDDADAVLTRTNAGAVAEIAQAIEAGKRVATAGDGKELRSFAEAARNLVNGQRTMHPELSEFKNWSEVRDYAEQMDDAGLRTMINLVDEKGAQGLVDLLDRLVPETAENVDVVVSTAHKSKGREWPRVRIGSDFKGPEVDKRTGDIRMPSDEDMRLFYVAVTRAEEALDPGSLSWVFDYTDENGGEPGDAPMPPTDQDVESPVIDTTDLSDEEVQAVADVLGEDAPESIKVQAEDLPTIDGDDDVSENPDVPQAAEEGNIPNAAPSEQVVAKANRWADMAREHGLDVQVNEIEIAGEPALEVVATEKGGGWLQIIVSAGAGGMTRTSAQQTTSTGGDPKKVNVGTLSAAIRNMTPLDGDVDAPEGEVAPKRERIKDPDEDPELAAQLDAELDNFTGDTYKWIKTKGEDVEDLPLVFDHGGDDDEERSFEAPEGFIDVADNEYGLSVADVKVGDLVYLGGAAEDRHLVIDTDVDPDGKQRLLVLDETAPKHPGERPGHWIPVDKVPGVAVADDEIEDLAAAVDASWESWKNPKIKGETRKWLDRMMQERGSGQHPRAILGLDPDGDYSVPIKDGQITRGMRVRGMMMRKSPKWNETAQMREGVVGGFRTEGFAAPDSRASTTWIAEIHDEDGKHFADLHMHPGGWTAVHQDDADQAREVPVNEDPDFQIDLAEYAKRDQERGLKDGERDQIRRRRLRLHVMGRLRDRQEEKYDETSDAPEDEKQKRRDERERRRRRRRNPFNNLGTPDGGPDGGGLPLGGMPVGPGNLSDEPVAGDNGGDGDGISDAARAQMDREALGRRMVEQDVAPADMTATELEAAREHLQAQMQAAMQSNQPAAARLLFERIQAIGAEQDRRRAADQPEAPATPEAETPRPEASDAQLSILARIAKSFSRGWVGDEEGAQRVAFNMPSLRKVIEKGWVTEVDRGAADGDLDRYGLFLTDEGREQLRRALAHNKIGEDDRYGTTEDVQAFLDGRRSADAEPLDADTVSVPAEDLPSAVDEPEGVDPVTIKGTPEYRAAYERGWKSGARVGGLDRADERGEPNAWYDGYHDRAADRPKWTLMEHDSVEAYEAAERAREEAAATPTVATGEPAPVPEGEPGSRAHLPEWDAAAATPEGVLADGHTDGPGYFVRNLTDDGAEFVGPDGTVLGEIRRGRTKKGDRQWVGVMDGREVAWSTEDSPFYVAGSMAVRAHHNSRPTPDFEPAPNGPEVLDRYEAVEADADTRPEPLPNGVIRNDGMVFTPDTNGVYTPEQIDYLADYGQQVVIQVGDEWHAGYFRPSQGDGIGATYEFDPMDHEQGDEPLRFSAGALNEVRSLRAAEMPGAEVDPAEVREGTRVAFKRGGKLRVGLFEGMNGQRAVIRDANGETHETILDGKVRPILGAYRDDAVPTERAFAPVPGVWQETSNGGLATGSPGEWVAGIVPDGQGGYTWELRGVPGSNLTGARGTADSPEAAKAAIEDALWLAAADNSQGDVSMLPADTEEDRDRKADELADVVGQVRDAAEETTSEPEGDEEETAAAPSVEGQPAAWVPTDSLEPGDTAHVEGDNGNGSATTRTGTVLGTPESVEVHEPGKPAKPGTRTTVGESADGDGDRGTVLTPEGAVAARAERDEDAGDEDTPQSVGESDVLSGRIGESVPTDRNGLGLFPGSTVIRTNGREGIVTEVTPRGVTVRWAGDKEDSQETPGNLAINPNKHNRPDGWTLGGQQVKPGLHIAETSEGQRGPVDQVDADQVGILTPDGMVYTSADLVTIVGQVKDGEPTKERDAEFDKPTAPEGLDVRPTDPIMPEALPEGVGSSLVNLKPEQRTALEDLGLDTDATSTLDVQQAAARIRHGMPISAAQAAALSEQLDRIMGAEGVPAGKARTLKRIKNRVDAAGVRAGGSDNPEPDAQPEAAAAVATRVGDVEPGDVIAVPSITGGQARAGIVVAMGPAIVREDGTRNNEASDVTVEYADGTQETLAMLNDAEVFRLPDMNADAENMLLPESSVAPFTEPRITERLHDAADAAVDAAVGDGEHEDLDALADQVNGALDGHADANDQRNSGRRLDTALEQSGVDEDAAADAADAAEQVADDVREQVADTARNTVEDAEALSGESDADAAARVRDRLREAADEVDYDEAAQRALDAAEQAALPAGQTGRPTEAQQAQARRELGETMRADLFEFADQLAELGDTESANMLAEVAARLAGKPSEEQVQRAVAAAAMGREPGRVRSLGSRIRAMFARMRRRFLDRVKAILGTGRKAKRSFKAAIAAARSEWNGEPRDVDSLIRDAAEHLAGGGDRLDVPSSDEPTGFGDRIAYWRDRLPESGIEFGHKETRGPIFRGLTLDALRGGRQVRAEQTVGFRLDRASDGGPGSTALGHLDALKGMGRAVNDEVDARVRAAMPDLGDDPAGAVREARRYADEVARDERGDLNDDELAKLRKKARKEADALARRFADAQAEAILDVLTSQRSMGPRGAARLNVQGRKDSASEVKALRWAEQHVPTDWLAGAGTVEAKAGRQGSYDGDGGITVAPTREQRDGAGKYGASALHGLAHHLEESMPQLRTAQWAYQWTRTSDGQRRRRGKNGLGWVYNLFPGLNGHRGDGTARAGDFPTPWLGVEDGETREVLALGMQSLFAGAEQYADDDLKAFMLGLLAYMKRNG